jgi:hypothetical protein
MNKSLLLSVLCCSSIAVNTSAVNSKTKTVKAKPANIILILIDDLRWKDGSPTKSRYYQTPNINKVALERISDTLNTVIELIFGGKPEKNTYSLF